MQESEEQKQGWTSVEPWFGEALYWLTQRMEMGHNFT